MSRHERFHADLLENIEKLVTTVEPSYILQQPMQTHIFNKNLATFLKVSNNSFICFDFLCDILKYVTDHLELVVSTVISGDWVFY